MAEHRSAALAVDGLSVRYGALKALDDVSWSVATGEILGIIGPNGAGKSSCFAAVTNSVVHGGETYLLGQPVAGVPTQELAVKGLRRTFQQNSFFGELTVMENAVSVLARDHSTAFSASLLLPWREAATRRAATAAARRLLDRFGIAALHYDKRPGEIPYGIQRLLSVALAYGNGPRVLLLDEPAAGIGGNDMRHLARILLDLRTAGLALVVIEHHMDLIMTVADRIVVIEQGRHLAEGPPAAIQADPTVLEAYLGRTQ
ncbi:ABC transporter ATP-binding protein [Chelatococcus reniformis]|uniref:ABC transporter ATP-binding protein n=1 Tax=Chelatococcus reniformis TaxID=1494448 RepID=UPI001FCF175B|nr:ATP-binding cassette domain-containing protein [Chelatococcus reniformis]